MAVSCGWPQSLGKNPARVSAAAQGRPSLAEPGPGASHSRQGAAFTLIEGACLPRPSLLASQPSLCNGARHYKLYRNSV